MTRVGLGRYLRGAGHGVRAEAQHAPLPHDHPAAGGAARRDVENHSEVPQEVHAGVRVGGARMRSALEFVTAKETLLTLFVQSLSRCATRFKVLFSSSD